ncbi:ABC transporter G family protein [Tieghemostelium lacteum]|uniref:ABC transporter G family protein n=1 Tax=Tieghemostelium lacteum TaxID=361077 RepID=A0A151ZBR4_TIELA|nr:ABC transporter G family protein [Tieghemostelium lacteum]|eukprot:KYQ91324.1 ABC transporter G family protein [Tieghemostelium lacteum]
MEQETNDGSVQMEIIPINNNNSIENHNEAIGNSVKRTISMFGDRDEVHSGGALKDGFNVTAKGLTVKVGSEKKKNLKNILTDLNFFLKPGSMTLLLGAPGCGKTSLFKVLAHQLHNETIEGSVLFNGSQAHGPTHHRDVGYVVQEDHHMAPFTVRETFKFSADLQMDENVTEQEKNERVDYILKNLDLTKQQDTVVGNEFLRGVSGGQKKRVTIGVELVKNPKLFLMDEPTTGLDSQTSLDLIKFMKDKVQKENMSCLIALLQPGIEITKLFDFLMIMNEGEMVYFGPMNDAIGYFEDLGFKLPTHHNPAEFFQEIVNEPELYYPGEGEPPLRGTEDFAQAYKKSEMYRQINNELANNIPNPLDYKDGTDRAKYPTTLRYQIHLTTIRAFKMLISNPIAVRMRIMKSIVMGLILGSLYWNLSTSQADANNRSGLIFFALLFIVFGGFGAIAVLFEQREVFYIQKDGKYYRTFSFFISLIFSEIPISFLETVIFVVLVYWMCGLQANAEKFIYFFLLCFVSDIQSQSFFKMVTAFSPNAIIASVLAPAMMAPFLLFSGFMVPKPSIKGWYIWLYWISPIKYGFEGLMSNEHHGNHYTCTDSELMPPRILPNFAAPYPEGFNSTQFCPYTDGDQFLDNLGMPQNNWFKWIDLLVVFAFGALYSILMYFFLKKVHYDPRAANAAMEKAMKKRAARYNKKREARVKVKSTKMAKIQKEIPLGCYMQWKDLVYEVDIKKDGKKQRLRLLKDINGYVKPGMLLALMGPSGAGKSTLLDVLANRKTGGHISGEMLINGQPRSNFFTRISGYVEQLDILPPTQTVREAIQFSAKCRLPQDMPLTQKLEFAENILETLNLLKIANRPIGHGEEGLSLSQRKRVNIGIELASDPQLIFLDEPTSGLDSSAALKVMNLIKKIASSGRSVICTIHQPSTSIFKKFDHLLLLKKGGETVFFGPTGDMSAIVLKYFEDHGLVCDPLKNPAEFILEVTDDVVNTKVNGVETTFDAVQAFNESTFNQDLVANLQQGVMPVGTKVPFFKGKYSSSTQTQFRELFKRAWLAQVRRVQNIKTRLMRSLMLGLILGTLYLQMPLDQENIYNRVSNLFFSLMFGGMAGMSTIPIVNIERGVFYREQGAGMYRIWIYVLTFIVTDLPWVFLSAVIYNIPNYFISGLYLGTHGEPFFYQTFISFLTYLTFSLLAMVLACVFPTDEIAHALGGVFLSIASLFAGFMIPPGSIPKGWKWFYHLDPIKYPLQSVMITEFQDITFHCPDNEGAVPVPVPTNTTDVGYAVKYFCPVTSGQQILDQYEMENDNLYTNLAVILAYEVFFIICVFIALTFIRHQTK